MPDKPLWLNRLPEAIRELEGMPEAWVDCTVVEALLGVGRRRAQQVLAPVASRVIGTSVLASRTDLIAYFQRIASGKDAEYEDRRRKKLWAYLRQAHREWIRQPPVLVEVSNDQLRRIECQDFDGLPEGVELSPGSVTLRFSDPDEALRQLMLLAKAISQNRPGFERRVAVPANTSTR